MKALALIYILLISSLPVLLISCAGTANEASAGPPAVQEGFHPVTADSAASGSGVTGPIPASPASTPATAETPPQSTETIPGVLPAPTETTPGGTATVGHAEVEPAQEPGIAEAGTAQVGPARKAGPVDTTPPELTPELKRAREQALEQSNQPGPR